MGLVFFLFPVFILDLLSIVMNLINVLKRGSLTSVKLVASTAVVSMLQAMVNVGISVFLASYPLRALVFVLGGLVTLVLGILMLIQPPVDTFSDTQARVSSKRVRIYSAISLALVVLELVATFYY